MRCLRRVDLMHALADDLPLNTIRFGCKMLSIKLDPSTSDPIMQIDDGSALHAKVVIGCDGVNSTVAKFLGMKSTRLFSTCVVRGFTRYPSGHKFHNAFIVLSKGNVQLGRMSVNGKLVYWFVTRDWTPQDSMVLNDPKLIKQSTMKALSGFPEVELDLIRNGDLDNLFLTPLRYHAPWELLLLQRRRFIQGAITVAGDAMHAMGPFIAQGGSACLEDAVVLARSFAQLTCGIDPQTREWKMMVQTAIDQYVKQRRMRVVQLSTQTFLIGTMLDGSSWKLAKFLCIALMVILFSDPIRHTRYDCGQL
ncbi:hypothetical protein CsSME_00024857 [Camellia sinensis var. sinensis]